MASNHTNAEICDGMAPTLLSHMQKDAPIVIDRAAYNQGANAQYTPHIPAARNYDGHPGGEGSARDCVLSNGQDVVGALCARDFKGVGSEYVQEGKVICHRPTHSRSGREKTPT